MEEHKGEYSYDEVIFIKLAGEGPKTWYPSLEIMNQYEIKGNTEL